VLNHNIETIPRLYPLVRPGADFDRSIALLSAATVCRNDIITKSGLMVGLGEEPEEVVSVLARLADAGCRVVTIGQYLQPSNAQVPVSRFVEPTVFERYAREGRRLGIMEVVAGPYVRSSYRACESARAVRARMSYTHVEGGGRDA
jgi:lipoyl synthase